MAYEKQNFTSGQVLTADHLNKIEEGICQNEKALEEKQPKGEYLTSTDKEEILQEVDSKQPAGDYLTDFDALGLLMETGAIKPLVDVNGVIYTDADGKIYTF